MKTILFALVLASAPAAFAHEHEQAADHAKKGQHKNAPTSFDKQPPEGTWARCPVSGDVFKVSSETEFVTYEGRVYAFCCPDCKPDFVKDPSKYADKKSS